MLDLSREAKASSLETVVGSSQDAPTPKIPGKVYLPKEAPKPLSL